MDVARFLGVWNWSQSRSTAKALKVAASFSLSITDTPHEAAANASATARSQESSNQARRAQRNFALRLRGLARSSDGAGRRTSWATSEYTPPRSPAWNDFLTRRSSPE